MANKVIIIRHGDDPPDDRVHTYFTRAGFEPVIKRPFAGDTLAKLDGSIAGTVIHGGKFNAFAWDEHPFLRDEDRWIGECLQAGVPMLGICQGAQQIAYHLGAEVGPLNEPKAEFGYYELRPMPEADGFLDQPMFVTQAHFHTFSIPEGARHLAQSDAFPNQAFCYGDKVYGFQFHPEVTIEGFRRWQKSGFPVAGMPGAQTCDEQTRLAYQHDEIQANWFYGFLDRLFGGNARG